MEIAQQKSKSLRSILPHNSLRQHIITSKYAMDPLTAVGLASNIIQFVEVASRILSAARKLHSSADGIAFGNEEPEVLALNLRDLAEVENIRQLAERTAEV